MPRFIHFNSTTGAYEHTVIGSEAPADAELQAGDIALWYDDTNAAAKLVIKAKTANGTVVNGNVALA